MKIKHIVRDDMGRFIRVWDRHRISVVCKKCGKKFETFESRIKCGKGKFCSKKCFIAMGVSDETRRKQSLARKGKRVSVKTEFRKGVAPWNKGKPYPNKTRGIPRPECRGENHPNWKGGISDNRHKVKSPEYRQWIDSVFKRDNWTCRNCGIKHCVLQAHHIKSWARFPNLRFDVDNGLALCVPCHKNTDNFKGRQR